jgi:hypothetical protein
MDPKKPRKVVVSSCQKQKGNKRSDVTDKRFRKAMGWEGLNYERRVGKRPVLFQLTVGAV